MGFAGKRIGLWCLVAAVGLAGCGGGSDTDGGGIAATAQVQPAGAAAASERVEPMTRSATMGRSSGSNTLRQRQSRGPLAQAVRLGELSQARLASEAAPLTLRGVPRKVGFSRPIAQAANLADTAVRLGWQPMRNGRQAAAISFTSPQARGLRLGLLVHALPAGAIVRIYAQGATVGHEIQAVDILATLQRNAAAGDNSDAAHIYWAPLVDGAETTVEIELPEGANPSQVAIAVPRLSHMFASPNDSDAVNQPKIGEAARCEVDVSCTSAYQAESKAVAMMQFVKDGGTYQCSGTLLNDKLSSGIPYFLSANHCVSTQTAASTLQTFWFYRSTSCNSQLLNPGYTTLTGGATLLYASAATDTSFMRLDNDPPVGAVYAGWATTPPSVSAAVFGLHFPEGDLLKVSTGTFGSFQSCATTGADDGSFSCATATQATGSFLSVTYSSGTTEAGSSGSPLFKTIGSTRYVAGQLYGGAASCRAPTGSNIYGRFDAAYTAALKQWLDTVQRSPVYRFYNATTGAHFYTISATERDTVIAGNASFHYEGAGFYAYGVGGPGLSPVYRFYNYTTRAHFYTVDPVERDYVAQHYPQFSLEGVVWYAQTSFSNGATPLYRFFKTNNGTHFYTPSAEERDNVRLTQPGFNYEGTAYYVWTGF